MLSLSSRGGGGKASMAASLKNVVQGLPIKISARVAPFKQGCGVGYCIISNPDPVSYKRFDSGSSYGLKKIYSQIC